MLIMKRVLVTGGAGFLGSHLCERLLDQGHKVLCLDDFSTGSRRNVQHLLRNPSFELIEHDVASPFFAEVDEIYNLACPASPRHYQHAPIKTVKTSVLGAINMLDMAKRLGIRLLHASTSEVYGDPALTPQPETYWGNVNPIGPRACYDEGKRCAETLCVNYHQQDGVRVKVARIFNTYGPRMAPDDGRVVANFVMQALHNRDITIFGDGSQTRSFMHCSDLVEGLLRLMDTSDDFVGPVNLGNAEEISILRLAELIVALTGSRSRLVFEPRPKDDPAQRCPHIALARRVLGGWAPQVPIERGLMDTIDYFRQLL